jgi:two-component system, NarL family, nitrate/nitrite response regulator NarL
MRALWIEDHLLIGDSLELLLQVVLPQLSVDKARELPGAARLAAAIPYELVLMDWWLGEVDGAQTIRRLREVGCTAPIVVVSGDDREPVIRQALQLGVAGYVRKTAEPEELIGTVKAVLAGGRTATPPAVATREGLPPLDPALLFPELTGRQLDVFRSLLRGQSDKEIARELGIGDATVKTHVRAILAALGVSSRLEAVYAARQAGV